MKNRKWFFHLDIFEYKKKILILHFNKITSCGVPKNELKNMFFKVEKIKQ